MTRTLADLRGQTPAFLDRVVAALASRKVQLLGSVDHPSTDAWTRSGPMWTWTSGWLEAGREAIAIGAVVRPHADGIATLVRGGSHIASTRCDAGLGLLVLVPPRQCYGVVLESFGRCDAGRVNFYGWSVPFDDVMIDVEREQIA